MDGSTAGRLNDNIFPRVADVSLQTPLGSTSGPRTGVHGRSVHAVVTTSEGPGGGWTFRCGFVA